MKKLEKKQKVQFLEDYGRFSCGDFAWITKIIDSTHVSVTNKDDSYCATDSCVPYAHEDVPTRILKVVGTTRELILSGSLYFKIRKFFDFL